MAIQQNRIWLFVQGPSLPGRLTAKITLLHPVIPGMAMSIKVKSTKKRKPHDLSEGPNDHRRQHSPFTRDVLTPAGAPVIARHRMRTVLTPLEVRRAILEDAASKPEAVRVRSLRRRLTLLDRALSDQEAEAIERLTSCINGLSNAGCINYLKSEVRSSSFGRLPFSESRQREIAAMTYVLRGLSPLHKSVVLELAILLDPSQSRLGAKLDEAFVASARSAAGAMIILYGEWLRRQRQRNE
jgi:hypothetical protein